MNIGNKPAFKPTLPNDFTALRKALIDTVQLVTGLLCVYAEPESPDSPRPNLPYFTVKIIGPANKFGDDSTQTVPDNAGNPTDVWNTGGQRRMDVDFNSYGNSHEEAYNYMSLWQASLELETTQQTLRAAGIAVWLNGSVADLSALLNTGFEGRAQMHVQFGIAFNLTANLGEIDTVPVVGTVTTDQNEVETINVTVQLP
jgi:hypothetical protein